MWDFREEHAAIEEECIKGEIQLGGGFNERSEEDGIGVENRVEETMSVGDGIDDTR